MGDNLVTLSSKKQVVVARSSAEVEFKSKAHGVCELLWLKMLLGELGFPCLITWPYIVIIRLL